MMFFLGVLRGADLQGFGALVQFVAFYFVGIPLSAFLGLRAGIGLPGVWYGNVVGMSLSALGMGARIFFTNWQTVAIKAGGKSLLPGTPLDGAQGPLLLGTTLSPTSLQSPRKSNRKYFPSV